MGDMTSICMSQNNEKNYRLGNSYSVHQTHRNLYAVLQSLFDLQPVQVAEFHGSLKHRPQSANGLACSTYLVEGHVTV